MERIPINVYAERVDGLVLPAPLSGHPVLDFCNTFSGWDGTDAGDYLKTYDHAVVWAVAGGLMEPAAAATLRRRAARRPEEAEAALRRVRDFRTDLYAILTKRSARGAWERVAADVSRAGAVVRLRPAPGPEGAFARWTPSMEAGLDLPRLLVARAAAALLAEEHRGSVRVCPGRGCGWLFLDRTERRRWCTMATCGNRAKVRRFAERARASTGARRGAVSSATGHRA